MAPVLPRLIDLFPINHTAFRGLALRSGEIFILLDPRGSRIRFAGPGAETYFPSGRRDRADWMSSFPDEERESLVNAFDRLKAGEESVENELRVVTGDGADYWLSVRAEAIRCRSGKLRRIAIVCRDISELRESRLKLVQAREYEVEVGARIQQSLLLGRPEESYQGMQIGAFTLPSQRIDGDFVDFFRSEESDETEFVLGDVMGKGIPAALLGAAARTEILKAQTATKRRRGEALPAMASILSQAEQNLAGELLTLTSFITLIYARINRSRSMLQFIDCGHTSTIHYDARRGHCWRIKGVNMPLGFSRRQEFRALQLDLHPGDILFAYSDGITEAVNSEEELFGEERLMHLIRSSAELDARSLLEKVKQITFAYCAGAFRDDVTAIAVKIDPDVPQNVYAEESFPQQMGSMRSVREFVNRRIRSLTGSASPSEERLTEIEIAVGEAVTNILRHQDEEPDDELRACVVSNGEWLSVKLEYSGREYDWGSYREPEIENYQESGYGLYLINTVMDSVLVEQGEMDRQRLIMVTSLEDRDA